MDHRRTPATDRGPLRTIQRSATFSHGEPTASSITQQPQSQQPQQPQQQLRNPQSVPAQQYQSPYQFPPPQQQQQNSDSLAYPQYGQQLPQQQTAGSSAYPQYGQQPQQQPQQQTPHLYGTPHGPTPAQQTSAPPRTRLISPQPFPATQAARLPTSQRRQKPPSPSGAVSSQSRPVAYPPQHAQQSSTSGGAYHSPVNQQFLAPQDSYAQQQPQHQIPQQQPQQQTVAEGLSYGAEAPQQTATGSEELGAKKRRRGIFRHKVPKLATAMTAPAQIEPMASGSPNVVNYGSPYAQMETSMPGRSSYYVPAQQQSASAASPSLPPQRIQAPVSQAPQSQAPAPQAPIFHFAPGSSVTPVPVSLPTDSTAALKEEPVRILPDLQGAPLTSVGTAPTAKVSFEEPTSYQIEVDAGALNPEWRRSSAGTAPPHIRLEEMLIEEEPEAEEAEDGDVHHDDLLADMGDNDEEMGDEIPLGVGEQKAEGDIPPIPLPVPNLSDSAEPLPWEIEETEEKKTPVKRMKVERARFERARFDDAYPNDDDDKDDVFGGPSSGAQADSSSHPMDRFDLESTSSSAKAGNRPYSPLQPRSRLYAPSVKTESSIKSREMKSPEWVPKVKRPLGSHQGSLLLARTAAMRLSDQARIIIKTLQPDVYPHAPLVEQYMDACSDGESAFMLPQLVKRSNQQNSSFSMIFVENCELAIDVLDLELDFKKSNLGDDEDFLHWIHGGETQASSKYGGTSDDALKAFSWEPFGFVNGQNRSHRLQFTFEFYVLYLCGDGDRCLRDELALFTSAGHYHVYTQRRSVVAEMSKLHVSGAVADQRMIVFDSPMSLSEDDMGIYYRMRNENLYRFRPSFAYSQETESWFMATSLYFVMKSIVDTWEPLLNVATAHVKRREDEILARPGDEGHSSRLWNDRSTWLMLSTLIDDHIAAVMHIRNYAAEAFDIPEVVEQELFADIISRAHDISGRIDKQLKGRTDNLVNFVFQTITSRDALASLEQARISATTGESMRRLTWVTFIFLPLTFLTGVFGMNVTTFPQDNPVNFKWYFIAAVPLMCVVIVLVLALRMWRPVVFRSRETVKGWRWKFWKSDGDEEAQYEYSHLPPDLPPPPSLPPQFPGRYELQGNMPEYGDYGPPWNPPERPQKPYATNRVDLLLLKAEELPRYLEAVERLSKDFVAVTPIDFSFMEDIKEVYEESRNTEQEYNSSVSSDDEKLKTRDVGDKDNKDETIKMPPIDKKYLKYESEVFIPIYHKLHLTIRSTSECFTTTTDYLHNATCLKDKIDCLKFLYKIFAYREECHEKITQAVVERDAMYMMFHSYPNRELPKIKQHEVDGMEASLQRRRNVLSGIGREDEEDMIDEILSTLSQVDTVDDVDRVEKTVQEYLEIHAEYEASYERLKHFMFEAQIKLYELREEVENAERQRTMMRGDAEARVRRRVAREERFKSLMRFLKAGRGDRFAIS